ncbi:MAG: 1-deoxy-D-xylulose-5-phosphate reductoisomerase [Vulcanimicrobiaceae bacterium]
MSRRRVAILGSTGSIGTQALEVLSLHPERFELVGLAAGRRVTLLREQVERFGVRVAAIGTDGPEGLMRVALESGAEVILVATDGFVAFDAVFAAAERGIDLAIANKELLVSAGELLVAAARRSGTQILPVDSEHNAIFQCLLGEREQDVASIALTASGGPFWRWGLPEMERASVAQALRHPTWQMGAKNTVDSATMMNKGLEVIEASRLFRLPGDRIHILVHPQSIAHGFVIFADGSVKAQLCAPDMRVPIGFALAYPDRLDGVGGPRIDPMIALGAQPGAPLLRYEFERPDLGRFPCVRLAYEALATGGTAPAALSAANEIAVAAFVDGKIGFMEIAWSVAEVVGRVPLQEATPAAVRAVDRQARQTAETVLADYTQRRPATRATSPQ